MDPAQTTLLSYFVPARSVFLIYNGTLVFLGPLDENRGSAFYLPVTVVNLGI